MSNELFFLKIDNNKLKKAVTIQIGPNLLQSHIKYAKHFAGCDEKSYYFLKKYKKGYSYNCWFVKKNNFPDKNNAFMRALDNPFGQFKSKAYYNVKNYLKDENIKVVPMIQSSHNFYSQLQHKRGISINYYYDAKIFIENGKISNNFFQNYKNDNYEINSSDFKNKNIKNLVFYFKKNQLSFEKDIKVKKIYSIVKTTSNEGKKNFTQNLEKNSNIVDKLKDLENLYKNGSITKKEFEKAKFLILQY